MLAMFMIIQHPKKVLLAALLLPALVVGTVLIHELAHLVAGALLGFHVVSFSWFDLKVMAPLITWEIADRQTEMTIVNYVGGLATGALWLACLYSFVRDKYAERNWLLWLIGLLIAGLASWQIGQGILEGSMHSAYMSGKAWYNVYFVLPGFALYLWKTHLFWRPWVTTRHE